MLTGHATVGTAIEGMKLGAYNYLIKPSETEDLVAKIMKAYKLKSEHGERIRSAELDSVGEI
jgi:ActR/RegA family two-component response regulator